MKLTYLLFLSLILCCAASPFGYHERIGVPAAEELKEAELLSGWNRIIGGTQVQDALVIPHQVGIIVLLTSGWTSICGGALVSNNRVLTAAHCWYDGQSQANQFTLVLGSQLLFSGGTRVSSSDVVVHPSWNAVDVTHDIAMVRMQTVSFSNKIQPIPLPTLADANVDFSGLEATVSGYGKTSDAQSNFPQTTSLHQATVSIISNAVCQRSFPEFRLHLGHVCTSGRGQGVVGTCDGDSGGPLTVVRDTRRVLVGIVSFGPGDGCERGLPSVYTRVTAFYNWIQNYL